MLVQMLAFEWRYFTRQPSFIVTLLVFFLLPFLAMAIEDVQIGTTSNTHFNSPYAIAQIHLVLGVFSMFLVVNFIANTALRNDQVHFAELVCTKPVNALAYQLGRFIGSWLVCVAVFAMVPMGILIGSLMPWLDAERIGPNAIGYYLSPFLVFSVPTLFVLAVLFYTAALKFRSQVAVYLVAILLFICYVVSGRLLDDPSYYTAAALSDPFGLRAFADVTRYWTPVERDVGVVALEGVVALNRAIWLGLSLALLGLFAGLWRPLAIHQSREKRRANSAVEPALLVSRQAISSGAPQRMQQLLVRTGFEVQQIRKSPAFYVLLLFSGFTLVSQLIDPITTYDAPPWPLTQNMLQLIYGSFALMMLIVIAYYSAEVVWRERGVGIGDIVDSLPVSNWVLWLSKLVAVWLVVLALFLVGAVVTIPYQWFMGVRELDFRQYAITISFFYLLPAMLMAVLAFFFQAVSANRYVGMLLFVAFIFISLAFGEIGLEHNLWNYASAPPLSYSDMNGFGWYLETQRWYMAYWSALAVVLGVFSHGLWQRGPAHALRKRLKRLPATIGRAGQWSVTVALVLFTGLGAVIYQSTTQLNPFVTQDQALDLAERYERELVAWRESPLPRITAVDATVDIYPREPRIQASALIKVTNDGNQPIERFLVNLPENSRDVAVEISGGALEAIDHALNIAWFRFAEPLSPGETRDGTLRVERLRVGFRDRDFDAALVENGTFIDSYALFPVFGFIDGRRISDRYERRKRDLPEIDRAWPLEDASHYDENFLGKNAGLIHFSATISTDLDQVAIAPGYLKRQWQDNGRHYFRYEQDAPMLNFYSLLSARLDVKKLEHRGVSIEVYYHATHHWNVDRMIEGARDSLDYFSEQFGPYPHRQLRIIEFPGYRQFAQSFANTVPYSETIGFTTDLRDPDNIDLVYYVTAHEVAHQWWAHQVVPANVQGSAILSETLSQYSALMVMKARYGEAKLRHFLTFELDAYLRGRATELVAEQPLLRAENQAYIHYRKGSVVMMALADRLGEQQINAALSTMIAQWRPEAERFPTTLDLLATLKRVADPADHSFIDGQFNDIALYELVNRESRLESLSDGRYRVTMSVTAKRYTADGQGAETEVPLSDEIDIVLFRGNPDDFSAEIDIIYRGKHRIVTGDTDITIEVDRAPDFAGVDPFVHYIDRNTDDNIRAVSGG